MKATDIGKYLWRIFVILLLNIFSYRHGQRL